MRVFKAEVIETYNQLDKEDLEEFIGVNLDDLWKEAEGDEEAYEESILELIEKSLYLNDPEEPWY